jgi:copper(I)-binding protein
MKWLALVALLFLGAPAFADDHDATLADMRILDPATLATPIGVTSAAIYMVVDNPSLEPDDLVAVSSPWAEEAGFAVTSLSAGKPMNTPTGALTILPGSTTVLGPNGAHVQLTNLRRTLQHDDDVPLTLTFAKAGERQLTAKVLSGKDFVKLYPLETTVLTIKKIGGDAGKSMLPAGLAP